MEKDAWNKVVNWVMSERRTEKMRALGEERERRLREVAKADDTLEGLGSEEDDGPNGVLGDCCPKKRRVSVTVPLPSADSPGSVKMGTEDGKGSNSRSLSGRSGSPTATIFGPSAASTCSTPRRTAYPSIARFIWPALSTPQRPNSPRRFSEKKRNGIYSGMGEYSPRGRGGTYTPPRILPSGDETATHGANGSSAPSLHTFDFVSPLGPVMFGKLSNGEPGTPTMTRKASLEAVKEDPAEDEEGWTVVQGKRGRRAGSLPCREKTESMNPELEGGEGMDLGT